MPVVFAPAIEPTVPGYSDAKTANARRAEFEGGYSQRSKGGPNPVGREVALDFEGDDASTDAIDQFFEARGGAEAFSYQLPWDSAPQIWTVASWSRVPIGRKGAAFMWRLSATFRREFDIT